MPQIDNVYPHHINHYPPIEEETPAVVEEPIKETAPTLSTSITATAIRSFPNLTWEILHLGIRKERQYQLLLRDQTSEASLIQNKIRKLLDFCGFLTSSEKSITLTSDAQKIAEDLKSSGIDLLKPGETKLSSERVAEIKNLAHSHIDRLKTELQTLFSTKIQVTINEMNSLSDTVKMTIKYFDRLIGTITANQRR